MTRNRTRKILYLQLLLKFIMNILYINIKVVPVLNYAPSLEGVLGSRGIVPRILDLGARWR